MIASMLDIGSFVLIRLVKDSTCSFHMLPVVNYSKVDEPCHDTHQFIPYLFFYMPIPNTCSRIHNKVIIPFNQSYHHLNCFTYPQNSVKSLVSTAVCKIIREDPRHTEMSGAVQVGSGAASKIFPYRSFMLKKDHTFFFILIYSIVKFSNRRRIPLLGVISSNFSACFLL